MGRLIDADKLIDKFDFIKSKDFTAIFVKTIIEIINKQPTVEAIPIDQYENRLKADMVAMLEKLKSEIILQVIDEPTENGTIAEMASFNSGIVGSYDIIQQKIDKLRGEESG